MTGDLFSLRPLVVRVAAGCDDGAEVTITPPDVLRVAAEVKARDGLPVAVRFAPGTDPGSVLIVARRLGGDTASVTVRVQPPMRLTQALGPPTNLYWTALRGAPGCGC